MDDVSLRAIRYAFAPESMTVRTLAERGLLRTSPDVLESFGFDRVHVATDRAPYGFARGACSRLLVENQVDPDSVDLLVWGGLGPPVAFSRAPTPAESNASHVSTERFRFPGTRLQNELGLTNAAVLGLDQMGCNSLFAAISLARAFALSREVHRALCVSAEFFPAEAGREAVFNCTSDAVVAVLVERSPGPNRIVAATHVTKGLYWNPDALEHEMVATYFPTARHVIRETIRRSGWAPEEVDWIIPHNVSLRSWEILEQLVGLPRARTWVDNIARRGHTLAGDNFINLHDARANGTVRPGQKLILFSFAYGAHWNGLAIEA